MRGFSWSAALVGPISRPDQGDLWCVRDSVCALMGWAPGSAEWMSFVEGPIAPDLDRLTEHLGLVWFDPEFEPHRQALDESLDHPGISVYALHSIRMSHYMYQPHIRNLRELPHQYLGFDPELFRLVVDTRQAPHAALG